MASRQRDKRDTVPVIGSCLDRVVDQAVALAGDIATHEAHVLAVLARGVASGAAVPVDDAHPAAVVGEPLGDRAADAAATAGDEEDLSCELLAAMLPAGPPADYQEPAGDLNWLAWLPDVLDDRCAR
jgi:hypothetical protein